MDSSQLKPGSKNVAGFRLGCFSANEPNEILSPAVSSSVSVGSVMSNQFVVAQRANNITTIVPSIASCGRESEDWN